MDCVTASVGSFFVVRWIAATPAGCDKVIKEVSALHASCGQRVAYLGIMPADMTRIEDSGRKALMELTKALELHTERAAVAMEARGFIGAATRSMLSGIMLVSGKGRIKFVDSVAAGMRELEKLALPDKDQVRAAIEKVGGSWT